VLITGAAGQIAYSLLYSVAKGDVFGKEQVIIGVLQFCIHAINSVKLFNFIFFSQVK